MQCIDFSFYFMPNKQNERAQRMLDEKCEERELNKKVQENVWDFAA